MKNVVIINGSPSDKNGLNKKANQLHAELINNAITSTQIKLRELRIDHCTGCWSCWNKTPGECILQDDVANCLRQIIHADLLIFAAPLFMGYPSALTKRFMDRMIPLVHPYIEWDRGECHHWARYEKYPRLALLLEKENDTDKVDINIVRDLFSRAARNLKSDLAFTYTIDDDMKEVCNEINHL
ncbi:MAG: flavodoxin family protein [Anaerolineaceae bacterium]|nr:flavodoxin family protein [Anaerolineaceae bacterium]